MIRAVVPAVAVAALLAVSSAFAGPVITTATGNGADVSIQNDSQNMGTSAVVFNGAGADFRRFDMTRAKGVLLRFDISTLTGDLNDAMLSFDYNHNRDRNLLVIGLTDESLDNWDEATTAYNNAPGILQPVDGGNAYDSGLFSLDNSKITLLGQTPILDTRNFPPLAPNGRALHSTDPMVVPLGTFLSSDTNGLVTFLLFHAVTDNNATGNITTKESTTGFRAPTLSTIAIPEPSALALLGIGGLALVGLRRKR
jgi:hypothetical protein